MRPATGGQRAAAQPGAAAADPLLRQLAWQEVPIARVVVDSFGEGIANLLLSDSEADRRAALREAGEMLGSRKMVEQRRHALRVVGQMIARTLTSDRSPSVLRAALQLLRTVLQ